MAKPIPYPFVLEALAHREPYTKPMFGFTGLYVGEKIVLCLNGQDKWPEDKGVWVAALADDHASLQKELPSMRHIAQFGPGPTAWQVIPQSSPTFEEEVLRACALIAKNDPRIGKVPKRRNPSKKTAKTVKKTLRAKPPRIPPKKKKSQSTRTRQ